MSLYEHFLNNTTKPIHKNLHYFPAYERHLDRFVNIPITFYEIGAGGGGSCQMWRRYLGPFATIVTLDIRPECADFADHQINVRIGDASNPEFLEAVIREFGRPDVVLDDGSHQMAHVNASFQYLYPRLSRTGVYVVEDMHTAYWEEYGGGLRRQGTFIENCKNMIDDLNADHIRSGLAPTEFTRTTISMHFYDSLVIFERGQYASKVSVVTGDRTQKYG